MGNCACIKLKEIDNGDYDNSIIIKIKEENQNEIDNKESFTSSQKQNYDFNKKLINLNKNTTDRDLLTINQRRADSILEYFNEIKLKPLNFLEEAKEHDVIDILNEYIESKNRILFIKNRFYNSLLESYVNRTPKMEKEIEKGLNNEIYLNKYDMQFYVVNSSIQDPNESIWTLIKQNKNDALNKLFIINISYLALCVYPIENSQNIKVYFLFLQLKNN